MENGHTLINYPETLSHHQFSKKGLTLIAIPIYRTIFYLSETFLTSFKNRTLYFDEHCIIILCIYIIKHTK